jgi:hypothetical protein
LFKLSGAKKIKLNFLKRSLIIMAVGLIVFFGALSGLLIVSSGLTINYNLLFIFLPILMIGINLLFIGAATTEFRLSILVWVLCFVPAFLLTFAFYSNSWLQTNLILCLETDISVYSFALLFLGASVFKEKNPSPNSFGAPGENWRTIFSTLTNLKKETSDVEKELSKIYVTYSQIRAEDIQTLRDLVHLYQFSSGLSNVPKEFVEPFQVKLLDALNRRGIKEWLPTVGQLPSEGCKKVPCEEKSSLPEGFVVKVHQSGFRMANGEVIESPIVEVVTSQKNTD